MVYPKPVSFIWEPNMVMWVRLHSAALTTHTNRRAGVIFRLWAAGYQLNGLFTQNYDNRKTVNDES